MSRIVAFGCSHTYGLELPDCLTVNDPPSKMGFPNILGKKLNLEVLNRADTGASQKQIAATILQTEFYKDDIIVINWSNPIRRGIWNGLHWEQLGPWNKDTTWKRFNAKYHYDVDDVLDTLMNINLANLYLKGKCKKIINSMQYYYSEIINSKINWNTVKIDLVFSDKDYYYNTLKDGHADLKSHEVFAERLFKLI